MLFWKSSAASKPGRIPNSIHTSAYRDMSLIQLLLIASGLSADAFAVAASEGAILRRSSYRHTLRIAFVFGTCQGIMPILGWRAGSSLYGMIRPAADLTACAILVIIGGKMLLDSRRADEPGRKRVRSAGLKLWILGLAVSLDALGVGISLAMRGMSMWMPALIIGLMTAAISIGGVRVGEIAGVGAGKKAELAGGVILIIIGLSFIL